MEPGSEVKGGIVGQDGKEAPGIKKGSSWDLGQQPVQ